MKIIATKRLQPSSTVSSPVLPMDEAIGMPEFREGMAVQGEGKRMIDCPYALPNFSKNGEFITSAEWRVQFENRFYAWMYGFTIIQ